MGYTHYFAQKNKPEAEDWKAFKNQIMTAFGKFTESESILICDGHGEIAILNATELFRDDNLLFNGHEDDAHESFFLPSGRDSEFNFCKTARKPYDLFVMISLILTHHYMPNCFDIGSDGNEDDWSVAFDWIKENFQDNEELLKIKTLAELKG
jgi:hypothetical protein